MDASLGRSRSLNVRTHPERKNESFTIASATVLPREKARYESRGGADVSPVAAFQARFLLGAVGNDSRGEDQRFIRMENERCVRIATRVDGLALESWRVQGGKRGASSLNMHTGDVPFPF